MKSYEYIIGRQDRAKRETLLIDRTTEPFSIRTLIQRTIV
jgi:hypothetical protein